MIYAQGIGPLHDEGNRSQTAKIMDRANAVTVRDNDSAVLLSKLGVKKDVFVTADPVLALNRDNVNVGLMSSLLLELGLSDKEGNKKKPLLFVSVRNWKDNRHLKPIAKLLDNRLDSGWYVVLVPAHYPDDVA
jgi:polysaccharide pyruvyl transferase WcaK-like protein